MLTNHHCIDTNQFVIDAPIFPGNSGSPAIYVPVMKFDPQDFSVWYLSSDMLIGLVKEVIWLRTPVIGGAANQASQQFIGIAYVEPAERIGELILTPAFRKLGEQIRSRR